jgi:antitoxin component of RelBE/YafQ-DinJ toxin-antitoxin module
MGKKKNLTISLDESLVKSAKLQADKLGISINEMIREFLIKAVKQPSNIRARASLFKALEEASKASKKSKWSRIDAYN